MKASRECIRYFIDQAVKNKAWAQGVDAAWKARASNYSLEMQADYASATIKSMARRSMNYTKYRASLVENGWPIDTPAFHLWNRLNSIPF